MAEAARPLVVVTRPQEESDALARRLRVLGYEVLTEPMLTIARRSVEIPSLEDYSALVFTSANGARIFGERCPAPRLPAYAVGPATAAALRRAGYRDVRTGAGDAAGLAPLIAREQAAGARLLHASGAAVAKDLDSLLQTDGIRVDRLAIYDAIPAGSFSETLVAALYACTVGFVLFFSARTAETFGTLAARMSLTERCCPITALCLSQQVGDKAARLPWARIAVAAEPTEEALLMLLPRRGADG